MSPLNAEWDSPCRNLQVQQGADVDVKSVLWAFMAYGVICIAYRILRDSGILQKIFSLKGLLSIGRGCPGLQWSHIPGSVQKPSGCGA